MPVGRETAVGVSRLRDARAGPVGKVCCASDGFPLFFMV